MNWYCPNCHMENHAPEGVAAVYHRCPTMAGLSAPMVPAGTKARIVAHEREDYIGPDAVFTDRNGRPIMSITTERDDGSNDTLVFAPAAHATVRTE